MAKVIDLSVRKVSPLVHVVFDELVHDNMKEYPRYLSTVRKIKQIALSNSFEHSVMSINTGSFANTELERLHELGFKWACLWVDGSVPCDSDFEDELITFCKDLDDKDEWMAIGHIINREGKYPYFHEQTVVINLATWYERTLDEDGSRGNLIYDHTPSPVKYLPGYIASTETIHDDYTPLVLHPARRTEDDKLVENEEFREGKLNRIIKTALDNHLSVYNFPSHIRKLKECVYLEDHADETVSWLFSDDYYMKSDEVYGDLKHQLRQNDQGDKLPLWSLKRQTENIVYITNTETVPNFDLLPDFIDTDVDTYVVPCSGFNQFEFMIKHLDTLHNIVFYDANRHSIAWMKHLITDWDGVSDLYEFIDEYLATLDSRINIIYNKNDVESFLERTTEEERINLFIHLREEKVSYHHIDIMREWNELVDAVDENAKLLINLTNIWEYEGNFINNTIVDCELAFYRLMAGLTDKNCTILFKGNTPAGKYIDCRNIHTGGGFS